MWGGALRRTLPRILHIAFRDVREGKTLRAQFISRGRGLGEVWTELSPPIRTRQIPSPLIRPPRPRRHGLALSEGFEQLLDGHKEVRPYRGWKYSGIGASRASIAAAISSGRKKTAGARRLLSPSGCAHSCMWESRCDGEARAGRIIGADDESLVDSAWNSRIQPLCARLSHGTRMKSAGRNAYVYGGSLHSGLAIDLWRPRPSATLSIT